MAGQIRRYHDSKALGKKLEQLGQARRLTCEDRMLAPEQALLSDAAPIVDAVDIEVERAVRGHSRSVYRVAYSVLRNHHDAEDVTQETFIRFLRQQKRKGLATVKDTRAWLARTAWRIAIDRTRRAPEVPLDEAAEAVFRLRAAGAGIDEIAGNEQMATLLGRLIESLPGVLRNTLILSTTDELSSPEIAEMLDIPEGSVRTRLLRARQMLREKLSVILEGKHGRHETRTIR